MNPSRSNRQPANRMQRAIGTASVIVLAWGGYALATGAGASWLTLVGVIGACVLVFAIHLLRPHWLVQIPLVLALFALPFVLLAWDRGTWQILVVMAGILLPVVIALIAVAFAARPKASDRICPRVR